MLQKQEAITGSLRRISMKNKPAAMNAIWLYLILISIIVAAYTGKMDVLTRHRLIQLRVL
jgi:hypothetical protein